jgi:hypothetical protein
MKPTAPSKRRERIAVRSNFLILLQYQYHRAGRRLLRERTVHHFQLHGTLPSPPPVSVVIKSLLVLGVHGPGGKVMKKDWHFISHPFPLHIDSAEFHGACYPDHHVHCELETFPMGGRVSTSAKVE